MSKLRGFRNGWWIVILLALVVEVQARTFTSKDGRTIEGTIKAVSADSVMLRFESGATRKIPLNLLIEDDQKFLAKWAVEEAKNRIPNVRLKINSNKSDRRENNETEDRIGEFQFEILVSNHERNFEIKDASATLIVLGDTMSDDKTSVVMQRKEFKNLSIPFGNTIKLNGERVRYEYDKEGYRHGEKYSGYLFVMRNPSGKVIDAEGTTTRYEKSIEPLMKLREGDHCDKSFQKVAPMRR